MWNETGSDLPPSSQRAAGSGPAFHISGVGDKTSQGIDSISIIDSTISGVGVGVLTNSLPISPNIMLDNTKVTDVGTAVRSTDGSTLLFVATTDSGCNNNVSGDQTTGTSSTATPLPVYTNWPPVTQIIPKDRRIDKPEPDDRGVHVPCTTRSNRPGAVLVLDSATRHLRPRPAAHEKHPALAWHYH
ncbi:hypothetical protein MY4824_009786 [Beauveria thailandica]